MTTTRHVFDVDSLTPGELDAVLGLAEADPATLTPSLAGKGVALLFEKPSARTRNSTEMAVVALGGHPVYIQGFEVAMDVRETAEDVARTLACYHDVLCARVMDHRSLTRMAAALDTGGVPVPVVNLLSDVAHPCQALADLLTLRHEFGGSLEGRTVAYIGDSNNVWLSLALAGAMAGFTVNVASPKGYGPSDAHLERIRMLGGTGLVTEDPSDAAAGFNYGLDKVRFLAPVPAGSRVRLRVSLVSVDEKSEGNVVLKTNNVLEIENSEKPALIAEALALLIPARKAN